MRIIPKEAYWIVFFGGNNNWCSVLGPGKKNIYVFFFKRNIFFKKEIEEGPPENSRHQNYHWTWMSCVSHHSVLRSPCAACFGWFPAPAHLNLMKGSLSGFSRARWQVDHLNQVCRSWEHQKHAGQSEMQHRVDPVFKRCWRRWTLLS